MYQQSLPVYLQGFGYLLAYQDSPTTNTAHKKPPMPVATTTYWVSAAQARKTPRV